MCRELVAFVVILLIVYTVVSWLSFTFIDTVLGTLTVEEVFLCSTAHTCVELVNCVYMCRRRSVQWTAQPLSNTAMPALPAKEVLIPTRYGWPSLTLCLHFRCPFFSLPLSLFSVPSPNPPNSLSPLLTEGSADPVSVQFPALQQLQENLARIVSLKLISDKALPIPSTATLNVEPFRALQSLVVSSL